MDDIQKILSYLKQFDRRLTVLESNKTENTNKEHDFNQINEHALSHKMQSRLDFMQKIKEMNPGLFVTIAKRVDGGGLLLTNKLNGENYKIKFYKSKNWSQNRIFGWFSVRAKDIYENDNDFYAMSVDYDNQNHNFIFSKQELLLLVQEKKMIILDRNMENIQEDIIHFYIEQQGDKFYETRELNQSLDKDRGVLEGGIDVSHSYNNLQLIKLMIGETLVLEKNYVFTNNEKVIKNLIFEILEHNFIIPIRKSDFVFSGSLLGYIEFKGHDQTFEVEKDILSKLKRVVLHIDMDKNMPASFIQSIKEEVLKHIGSDIPLVIGVSLNEVNIMKSSIVFIGEYLID
jgi:hypothetical protein